MMLYLLMLIWIWNINIHIALMCVFEQHKAGVPRRAVIHVINLCLNATLVL